DLVEGVVHALAVAHVIEYEELRLRTEIGSIGTATPLQMGLGLPGDVTGVSTIGFAGDRVSDVANQDQRRRQRERVEKSRGWVRHDQHIAFLDFLEAAYR